MGKINIDKFVFAHMGEQSNNRTRLRLQELVDMGCEETGIASFGVVGVVSGLYIEKVWSYSDEDWNDYIKWMSELVKENEKCVQ